MMTMACVALGLLSECGYSLIKRVKQEPCICYRVMGIDYRAAHSYAIDAYPSVPSTGDRLALVVVKRYGPRPT